VPTPAPTLALSPFIAAITLGILVRHIRDTYAVVGSMPALLEEQCKLWRRSG